LHRAPKNIRRILFFEENIILTLLQDTEDYAASGFSVTSIGRIKGWSDESRVGRSGIKRCPDNIARKEDNEKMYCERRWVKVNKLCLEFKYTCEINHI
jgi:hypothetical protein